MKELDKTYNPSEIEGRIYDKWMEKKYFHAEVNRDKKPFTIVMPPPNITGQLHMGHALDNTMQDILIRYKDIKRIYAYQLETYWNNISSVEAYYRTNMDFLKRDVRSYFFKEGNSVFTKVDDLPPAKYNPGANISNSLIACGSIVNGTVENSVVFKKAYIGNNCVIKNSIIMNDVYIGDNAVIENCIVESRGTIEANACYKSEPGDIRIVVEKKDRFII